MATHTRRWPPSKRRLEELIEQAIIDAYGDAGQRTGFLTMLEEKLELPTAPPVHPSTCASGGSGARA